MNLFTYYFTTDCCYFRLFGYGLHLIDRSKHKPLFSVRSGKVKEYRVGKWGFKVLRKGK